MPILRGGPEIGAKHVGDLIHRDPLRRWRAIELSLSRACGSSWRYPVERSHRHQSSASCGIGKTASGPGSGNSRSPRASVDRPSADRGVEASQVAGGLYRARWRRLRCFCACPRHRGRRYEDIGQRPTGACLTRSVRNASLLRHDLGERGLGGLGASPKGKAPPKRGWVIARQFGVNPGTVQRIARPFEASVVAGLG
jgi:hypothetical protein